MFPPSDLHLSGRDTNTRRKELIVIRVGNRCVTIMWKEIVTVGDDYAADRGTGTRELLRNLGRFFLMAALVPSS